MNPFSRQRTRITWGLLGVFGLLGLSALYLVYFSYGQLRFESFYVQRNLAEDFINRVASSLQARLAQESKRAPGEYEFIISSNERFGQISPLANLDPTGEFPGTLGYFQVDAAGQFSSPLLPKALEQVAAVGLSEAEVQSREAVRKDLRALLAVAPAIELKEDAVALADDDSEMVGQVATTANRQIYDELSKAEGAYRQRSSVAAISRVDELKLKKSDVSVKADSTGARAVIPARKKAAADASETPAATEAAGLAAVELSRTDQRTVFSSTINQFRLTILNAEHVAFHRDVWLAGERRIQGFVVSIEDFTESLIAQDFRAGQVSATNDLTLALGGGVIGLIPARSRGVTTLSAHDVDGNELLLRRSLVAPAEQFELVVSTAQLPFGSGIGILLFTGGTLVLVVLLGFFLLNRLMHRSVDLAEQQQDFVSAVTHELKTPLTSIRMYGEILRAGWADEEKKKTYYDFIFYESERLSRLINNVLQLARMTRGSSDAVVVLQPHSVARLVDAIAGQSQAQLDGAGFELIQEFSPSLADIEVQADSDAFQQVIMNLVDNAIKFSRDSDRKQIAIGTRKRSDGLEFYVRDFGPGVPEGQMRKIFKLFYRVESELTRETVGTGIGLALVAELVEKMRGTIDVVNQSPGAEFSVRLKLA